MSVKIARGVIPAVKIIKIAIVGAHGVGKTTLANALCGRLDNKGFGEISIASEIPREICSLAADPEFYRRGKNNALKQALLLVGQLQREQSFLPRERGVLICDRGVLDLWAYSKYLFENDFRAAEVLDLYEVLIARHCRSYRMHFYVPAEFPPSDDGIRESDAAFQAGIDRSIQEFLAKYGVPHRQTRGSIAERCSIVETELRALATRKQD